MSSAASVRRAPNIVAILGPIIAAPLAMPVICTLRPPIVKRRHGKFVRRVGGQHAARCRQQGIFEFDKPAAAARMPATILSIGINAPMMPVDRTSTAASEALQACGGQRGHFQRHRERLARPVHALALPELITTARMSRGRRPRTIPGRPERRRPGFAYTRPLPTAGRSETTSDMSSFDGCVFSRNTRRTDDNREERHATSSKTRQRVKWTRCGEHRRNFASDVRSERRRLRLYSAMVSGKPS